MFDENLSGSNLSGSSHSSSLLPMTQGEKQTKSPLYTLVPSGNMSLEKQCLHSFGTDGCNLNVSKQIISLIMIMIMMTTLMMMMMMMMMTMMMMMMPLMMMMMMMAMAMMTD